MTFGAYFRYCLAQFEEVKVWKNSKYTLKLNSLYTYMWNVYVSIQIL